MARARWPSGGRLLLALLWLWGAAADVLYGGEECAGIVDFPLKDDTNFTAVDVRCRPRSLRKPSPLPPMLSSPSLTRLDERVAVRRSRGLCVCGRCAKAQVRALLTNREVWPVWLSDKCHAANRRRVCLINYDDHSAEDKQVKPRFFHGLGLADLFGLFCADVQEHV